MRAKPCGTMTIELGEKSNSDNVYTSGSNIKGTATLTVSHDFTVKSLALSFLGTTSVALGSLHDYASTKHEFLRLKMPSLDQYLPDTRVLRSGQAYTIPFHFVIPHQLNLRPCNHPHGANMAVFQAHTLLPPTVGCWNKTDKTPDMIRIKYLIEATVTGKPSTDNHTTSTSTSTSPVIRSAKLVLVLPASQRSLPLTPGFIEWGDSSCANQKVRPSRLKPAVGSFSCQLRSPRDVILSTGGDCVLGSKAYVDMEFTPLSKDVAPPAVHVEAVRIMSTVFYSTTPIKTIPSYDHDDTFTDIATIATFHLPPAETPWTPSVDAGISSPSSQRLKASALDLPVKYTATLVVPFVLLKRAKTFLLPTFHSCFISKTYILQLKLLLKGSNRRIMLAVPLQLSVEGVSKPDNEQPPPYDSIELNNGANLDDDLTSFHSSHTSHSFLCTEWNAILPSYEA